MIEDTWRSVLVVDRDDDVGRTIASALSSRGYDVVPADHTSAVQLARILRPSAVVLCIDIEGAVQLAPEIRRLDPDVLIVALGPATECVAIDRCVPDMHDVANVVTSHERSRTAG